MAFGITNPVVGGSIDTWGATLNNINDSAEGFVTLGQVSITLPLYKGDGTYRLHTANVIPHTIEEVNYSTDDGTLTISNISIGTSPITGFSALSASSTPADATASGANDYNSGNLSITVASTEGAEELYLRFKVTQTAERT